MFYRLTTKGAVRGAAVNVEKTIQQRTTIKKPSEQEQVAIKEDTHHHRGASLARLVFLDLGIFSLTTFNEEQAIP
jgi:hypothetical protein